MGEGGVAGPLPPVSPSSILTSLDTGDRHHLASLRRRRMYLFACRALFGHA